MSHYPENAKQDIFKSLGSVHTTLKDGTRIKVRPLKPTDKHHLLEMYGTISPYTQNLRFGCVKSVEGWRAINIGRSVIYVDGTDVDYDTNMSIVAVRETRNGIRIVGDARYVLNKEKNEAECTLLIHDDYHNLGLGTQLMQCLLDVARKRNIDRVYACIANKNKKMLYVARKTGFEVVRKDSDEHFMKIDL
ncbi:MAG: GNAT family N-acetyltransferase [Candidatus Hodarchaeota archaeon]